MWDGINALMNAGTVPFVLVTVSPSNFKSLPGLASRLVENHIGFRLSLVRDMESFRIPEIHNHMAEVFEEIFAVVGGRVNDVRLDRFCRVAEVDLDRPKRGRTCNVGRSNIGVSASGAASLCQMHEDKPFGNLYDMNVLDRMRLVGEGLRRGRPSECEDCQWKYACAGACPKHACDVFGTYNHPSPWCETYKLVLPMYIEAAGRQALRILNAAPAEVSNEQR